PRMAHVPRLPRLLGRDGGLMKSRKPKFRRHRGVWLAPAVELPEAVVRQLVANEYTRQQGGHCDLCAKTWDLQLVRRDGAPRAKNNIFGLATILKDTVKAGASLALPIMYAVRCVSCRRRVAAERKRGGAAEREARARERQDARRAGRKR